MAQEARLVNGGLRNKLNSRIVALVLESRHRWASRQSIAVELQDNAKTLRDALQDGMPEDRAEARQWLETLVNGQGTDREAEAVREIANQILGEFRLDERWDPQYRLSLTPNRCTSLNLDRPEGRQHYSASYPA